MKKYLKPLILIIIVALLLLLAFKGVNFTEVWTKISQINILYPLAFLLCSYLQYFARAYRWSIILKPHKADISVMSLYNFTAIGFLLNILPGRVGEAARGILAARKENFDQSAGLASAFLERMVDLLMLLVIFWFFLVFTPHETPFLLSLKQVSHYLLPIILSVFALFYLINIPAVFVKVSGLIRFFCKVLPRRLRDGVSEFIIHFLKALKMNLSLPQYLLLLLSSLTVWLLIISAYWILFKGFLHLDGNMAVSFLDTIPYVAVLGVFAVIPTPGMGGTFEAGSQLGLTKLYAITPDTAMAYTLVAHFMVTICWTVPGFIALWMEGLNFRALKDIKKDSAAQNATKPKGDGQP